MTTQFPYPFYNYPMLLSLAYPYTLITRRLSNFLNSMQTSLNDTSESNVTDYLSPFGSLEPRWTIPFITLQTLDALTATITATYL
jgi:hypothetical protein